jgi:hypothetical protein
MIILASSWDGKRVVKRVQPLKCSAFLFRIAWIAAWHTAILYA